MVQLKGRKDECGTSRRLEHVYNPWGINTILIVWGFFLHREKCITCFHVHGYDGYFAL